MKYIYIAGLEHSGSTLLNELLAQQPGALGLGEVGVFFSPAHMRVYLERWGRDEEARLCSCGNPWKNCEFWSNILHLSGEYSNAPILEKYQNLFQYIHERFPEVETVVDSTKGTSILKLLLENRATLSPSLPLTMKVLHVVKDVRSFTASIARKTGHESLLGFIRTMNWWIGGNAELLRMMNQDFRVVLYERLCKDPDAVLDEIYSFLGFEKTTNPPLSSENRGSHIVLGNRNFLIRNRQKIRYDNAWLMNDRISLAYLLNWKARSLNHRINELAI